MIRPHKSPLARICCLGIFRLSLGLLNCGLDTLAWKCRTDLSHIHYHSAFGLFFALTGVIGLFASYKEHYCSLSCHMIMSMIGTIVCYPALVTLAVIDLRRGFHWDNRSLVISLELATIILATVIFVFNLAATVLSLKSMKKIRMKRKSVVLVLNKDSYERSLMLSTMRRRHSNSSETVVSLKSEVPPGLILV